ncbi:TrfB-related DNA-binding protein [Verminephrobacter aporrectodeae]|uniref:TrfB-related DNA-binding protein n=1 Tax=Verminephrobacter aporrectodeae TaxID=1110389 RepID=UPI0002377B1C|nr:TrfB-related DNA-binding protein [Verminephrobacter aporrectodeae]
MTGAEFEAVRPLLKISDDRIKAARQALVDGQTLQAIGDQFGWSRQAVGDAVSTVWKTLGSYYESQRAAANACALLQPGWEKITLIAPSHLVAKFRSEIAQASPQPVKKSTKAKKKD